MDDERETSQADAPASDSMQPQDQNMTQGKTTCRDCMGTGSREGEDCITCGGTGIAPEESAGGG
jgi:DnaJ-class molecular chaperone